MKKTLCILLALFLATCSFALSALASQKKTSAAVVILTVMAIRTAKKKS